MQASSGKPTSIPPREGSPEESRNALGLPLSNAAEESAIWSRYRDNLARHLIAIARDLEEHVQGHLAERGGYAALRPSFGPLIAQVWNREAALGEIAAALAISPQAASQLVSVAERAGYVSRRAHPDDRRARRVAPTKRGRALVEAAALALRANEARYQALVAEDDFDAWQKGLVRLAHGLALSPGGAQATPATEGALSRLPLISFRIQQDLMKWTSARGHAGLKLSHAQILPLIGPKGARVHALASVQGVTRQAISATARDLESLGYLRRDADAEDRRGVVLRLTPSGMALIRDSVTSLAELDARFREILGGDDLSRFDRISRALYRALRVEDDIFASMASRSDAELDRLATRLLRELGEEDAARLAERLDEHRAALRSEGNERERKRTRR